MRNHSVPSTNCSPAQTASPAEAVIYVRVSSERQAKEGDGARSQEQRCRAYAQASGYHVLHTFADDGVSGAAIERPGMRSLLEFLRSRPAHTAVIVDDISRVARDVNAHFQLRAAIHAAGGRLESPSFTFGDTAADELIETIMAATAQFGRKGNREQVLNRMRARLEQGYWTFPAPPGYRYERHPAHKKWLVPTKEAREILGPALVGYATGRFAMQRELAVHLRDQGFFGDTSRVSRWTLEKRVSGMMAMLPLYAGYIEYPDWGIARRKAQHEPVIATAVLERLEARLASTGRPWGGPRRDADSALILRNFIRCAGCGRPLTGSLAKGKYARYHCYNKGCALYGDSYSSTSDVLPAFRDLLRSLKPSPELAEYVGLNIAEWAERAEEERKVERTALDRAAAQARREIEALVRRIARTSSDAVAVALEQEVEALTALAERNERLLSETTARALDWTAAWEAVNTYFCDPLGMWESGSDKQKRTVQRMVFAVPPAFGRGQGFNTYELTLPYRVSTQFTASKTKMVDPTGESWHLFRLSDDLWQRWFDYILQWAAMLL